MHLALGKSHRQGHLIPIEVDRTETAHGVGQSRPLRFCRRWSMSRLLATTLAGQADPLTWSFRSPMSVWVTVRTARDRQLGG
jgi:hypothetical protein